MEKQRGRRRDLLGWLISLFGLDEYGQDNLPRHVRTAQISFVLVLVAVATIELIGWTYRWHLVTDHLAMAIALGVIFAGAAVLLDRAIIVASSKVRPSLKSEIAQVFSKNDAGDDRLEKMLRVVKLPILFLSRLVLLYALAYYTALPFSVLTFKSEIEKHLTVQESQNYTKLVDEAVQKTEREFGRQIEARRLEGEQQTKELSARAFADVEAYKKQRAVERESRVESHDAAIQIQKETVERSEKERNVELDQGVGPRKAGAGEYYYTKDASYAKEQEQLRALQTAKIQELRTFDEETLKHVASKEVGRDMVIAESVQAVQRLRSEMQTKIKELRNGPVGSVPGEWRVARGYAAQELALAQIEQADKTGTTTRKRQESHWLMMAFGLMVVILKMGLDSKISAYYDPYAQAAGGNGSARKMLATTGITDFVAYVRPTEVKLVCVELGEKRQALDRAFEAFTMRLHVLAGPVPASGRFRRLSTIQTQLQAEWLKLVAPAQKELLEFEQCAREFGIEKVVEGDLSRKSWVTSEEQLRELGWQSPTKDEQRNLEAAFQKLLTQREQLLAQTRSIAARAAEIALGAHETVMIGFEQLRSSREQQLLMIANQIVAAEAVVSAYDETVPAWDGGSSGNFLTAFWQSLEERMVLVALRKTREKFLEIARESDRQMAIKLHMPASSAKDSPYSMSHERRLEYNEKLLPLQVLIEQLEARCDVIPDWLGDPRPFENYWQVTREQMVALGWIAPLDLSFNAAVEQHRRS